MSELNEPAPAPAARRNPLAWIALVVVGLILFVFLSGDREDAFSRSGVEGTAPEVLEQQPAAEQSVVEQADAEESVVAESVVGEQAAGTIDRSLLLPPGMRAREYIQQIRAAGKPYPLSQVFDRAEKYHREGSLADAHLLYFFSAREGHLPSIMVMAEMSDPVLFQAENSLLDQADVIQAYKWYRRAEEQGQPGMDQRIDGLRVWAVEAASVGNAEAEQLLLNFQ